MIKTLPLPTIPLLGATPSVVLAHSDSWVLTVTGARGSSNMVAARRCCRTGCSGTPESHCHYYRSPYRKFVYHVQEPEVLLIRQLTRPVARQVEAAHQKVTDLAVLILYGAGRHTATDLLFVAPDDLRVMTVNLAVRPYGTIIDRGAWDIIALFVDPEVEHRYQRRVHIYGVMGCIHGNDLAKRPSLLSIGCVECFVERRQMFGPSLGVGGELVAPHERLNSNGSALAVHHPQDGVDEISIVTLL
jgi:hypothetical protein